jgi:hypothetical protein
VFLLCSAAAGATGLVDGCTEAGGLACSDADAKTKAKEENPQHRRKADTRTKNAKSKFVPKKWPVSSVLA